MPSTPEKPTLEAEIQDAVDDLRGRWPDTRALYREVCALLFFRFGITPSANRLYNLVRKGSMGTPADVLNQFWADLRKQMRVNIEHPELPDSIKQVAATAVLGIWREASKAAAGELAALREEALHQVNEAESLRDQALVELEAAKHDIAAGQAKLLEAGQALIEEQTRLHAERAAHAATEARLEETRGQVEERDRQLNELRTQFSIELEHARAQVSLAEERAAASERRALLDLDQERTLRQKSERLVEDLRAELAATRSAFNESSVQATDLAARQQAELQGLERRLMNTEQTRSALEDELAGVRTSLSEALLRAERADVEVAVTRRLLAEFKPGPAPKRSRPSS